MEPELELPRALTDHVGYLGVLLGQRAQAAFEQAIAVHDLVPGQYDYLAVLAELGPLSQRRIAAVLDIDPSRVVALTDELGRRGLVDRQVDPDDRRRNLVSLTRSGRAFTARIAKVAAVVEQDLVRVLSRSEQDELRRLLRLVAVD